MSFFLGGGPACQNSPGKPDIDLRGAAVIPTEFPLCLYGFEVGQPLRITLTPPAGRAITDTLPGELSEVEDGYFYRWPRLPSDPAGRHRISVRQGDTEITETFEVVRPRTPRLWLDRPNGGVVLGTDVHMYLAGFPANRTVALHLYRAGRYRTSFPARTDAGGGAHAVLRTAPGDPLGCWGVSHPSLGDPAPPEEEKASRNVFCTIRG